MLKIGQTFNGQLRQNGRLFAKLFGPKEPAKTPKLKPIPAQKPDV